MSLVFFFNLLILIGTCARMILISEACLNDGSYCSWGGECCSKKCEYLSETLFRTCTSERRKDKIYHLNVFETTTSLSVEEPLFCMIYGQCKENIDCCSKECIKGLDGAESNECKESRRRKKHQYYS